MANILASDELRKAHIDVTQPVDLDQMEIDVDLNTAHRQSGGLGHVGLEPKYSNLTLESDLSLGTPVRILEGGTIEDVHVTVTRDEGPVNTLHASVANPSGWVKGVYDPSSGKYVFLYCALLGSDDDVSYRVGTFDSLNQTFSFTLPTTQIAGITTAGNDFNDLFYDPIREEVIFVFANYSSQNRITAIAGTVNPDDTITWHGKTDLYTGVAESTLYGSDGVYNSYDDSFLGFHHNTLGGNGGLFVGFTYNGTTFTPAGTVDLAGADPNVYGKFGDGAHNTLVDLGDGYIGLFGGVWLGALPEEQHITAILIRQISGVPTLIGYQRIEGVGPVGGDIVASWDPIAKCVFLAFNGTNGLVGFALKYNPGVDFELHPNSALAGVSVFAELHNSWGETGESVYFPPGKLHCVGYMTNKDGINHGPGTCDFKIDPATFDVSSYGHNPVGTAATNRSATMGGPVDGNVVYLQRDDSVDTIYATAYVPGYIDFDPGSLHGVLQETGTAGQSKKVSLMSRGISRIHSGLTPGSNYYLQSDGSISDVETIWPIGIALSDTDILLQFPEFGDSSAEVTASQIDGFDNFVSNLSTHANRTDNPHQVVVSDIWKSVIKTGNYDATNCDEIHADSTGGSFNITLPLTPSIGTRVKVIDFKDNFATAPVTILRNGENIKGVADDLALDLDGVMIELFYVDSTYGWTYRFYI